MRSPRCSRGGPVTQAVDQGRVDPRVGHRTDPADRACRPCRSRTTARRSTRRPCSSSRPWTTPGARSSSTSAATPRSPRRAASGAKAIRSRRRSRARWCPWKRARTRAWSTSASPSASARAGTSWTKPGTDAPSTTPSSTRTSPSKPRTTNASKYSSANCACSGSGRSTTSTSTKITNSRAASTWAGNGRRHR